MTESETTSTKFMDQCAFAGLDLGFWIFRDVEKKPEDLKAFCGYDTHFDEAQGKCVPRETPVCKAIDLTGITDDTEKSNMCNAVAGCSLATNKTACGVTNRCTALDLGDDRPSQKEQCDANPNCTYDIDEPIPCYVANPGLDIETTLYKGCGKEQGKLTIQDLCGPGTVYDEDAKQCRLPGNN